jgi:hypothetical protein
MIRLSDRLYAMLLRLYPAEIRQRWEAEMAETFTLQLADAWQGRGLPAVTRVWYLALAEVFQIALPLQLARSAVPMISLAGTSAIFFSLIWALQNSLALNAMVRSLFHKFGG